MPLVGGKGANLGEMTHAGYPIPSGFCLTTTAFQQFMDAFLDSESIYKQLDTITPNDVETVRSVGEHIRQALLDVPMPDDIVEAVKQAWQSIGTEHAYAVRSSATAEDLPDASFAGQQDTYLNIMGEVELLDAIRSCWVSLFTDRAILYRSQNKFDHRDVQLSVVVQHMVMSETSGILFTADPLTGHRHTLTINASFGLGEALVSGLVSPDAYRIDKRTRTILERQIADKQIGIFPEKDWRHSTGSVERSSAQANRFDRYANISAGRFGVQNRSSLWRPAGISSGQLLIGELYLLQARPITSLYPIDGLKSPDDSLHVFLSLGHQQSMMNAMSPLSLSTIQVMMPIGHAEEAVLTTLTSVPAADGCLLILPNSCGNPVLRKAMFGLLSQLDALAPETVRQVMKRPEFQRPHGMRFNLAFFKGVCKIAARVFGALWSRNLTGFVDKTNALMDEYIAEVTRSMEMLQSGRGQLEAVLDAMPEFFPFFPQLGSGNCRGDCRHPHPDAIGKALADARRT